MNAWTSVLVAFTDNDQTTDPLERMKLDISNLVLQIEHKECCHYTLQFCSMGMHSGSRDLLNFWEISANISEMVQDRDIVTIED